MGCCFRFGAAPVSIETLPTLPPSDQVLTKTTEPRRGGRRPRGDAPPKVKNKPRIVVDGDELWPLADLGREANLTPRTVKRMAFGKGLLGGVLYGSLKGFRAALAAQMVEPGKKRRGRR
jgi:hypothetical protein